MYTINFYSMSLCMFIKDDRGKFTFIFFTEKVTCKSEPNGIEHNPGDMFNDDQCESRCECTDAGNIVCQPLNCPTGLIRRGNLHDFILLSLK